MLPEPTLCGPAAPPPRPRVSAETCQRLLAKAKQLVEGMSEETRKSHLARAKKMLQEYQKKNNLLAPADGKKKKKTKDGSDPKRAISEGSRSAEEGYREDDMLRVAAQGQHQLEDQAPTRGTGGHGVPLETRPALQVAMDKLQSQVNEIRAENVQLKLRVQELERRVHWLSAERGTPGQDMARLLSAGLDEQERPREQAGSLSRLFQDMEDVQVKLRNPEEMLLPLVGQNNMDGGFLGDAQNPDDVPTTAPPPLQDMGTADSQDVFVEVSLADSVELDQGEALRGLTTLVSPSAQQTLQLQQEITPEPPESPSAQQTLQLQQEITQEPPESPSAQQTLQLQQEITQEPPAEGSKPCIPFFYRGYDFIIINI